MPAQINHQHQAEQNERLARGLVLLSPPFMDWGVTACFYTALHLVDEYLAQFNIHPRNHQARRTVIRDDFHPIHNSYRRLERASIYARYECYQTDATSAFQPGDVQSFLDTELQAIKDYLATLP